MQEVELKMNFGYDVRYSNKFFRIIHKMMNFHVYLLMQFIDSQYFLHFLFKRLIRLYVDDTSYQWNVKTFGVSMLRSLYLLRFSIFYDVVIIPRL